MIISCEHGGCRIPARYKELYAAHQYLLQGHRGYDRGAAQSAQRIMEYFDAPGHIATVSRLLVDLNRSIGHPHLFSEISRLIAANEKKNIIEHFYYPYRNKVEASVAAQISASRFALHLSIHTFTPILNNHVRNADIGFLYDPTRQQEKDFCQLWKAFLRQQQPELRVRRNYPYHGTADSVTTYFRRMFPPKKYGGIEVEINQQLFSNTDQLPKKLADSICESLQKTLNHLFSINKAQQHHGNKS